MNTVTLKAHFDGEHIRLDEPYPLQPDAKLVVLVIPESDDDFGEERAAWYALSQQSLARANGDDEPDYSDYVGKTPPPD